MKYTKDKLAEAVKKSTSFRRVAMELHLNESGGTYQTLRKKVVEWSLDVSHFLGKGSNKGKKPHNNILLADVLSNKIYLRSVHLKEKLLKAGIFKHQCMNATCQLTQWLGKPIVLELDHIDGNRRNNQLENLRLLCPNCHSQTDTWRNRKRRGGGMADPQP